MRTYDEYLKQQEELSRLQEVEPIPIEEMLAIIDEQVLVDQLRQDERLAKRLENSNL